MTDRHITTATLVSGHSESSGWTFTSGVARALFRVGSGPSCNWRVRANGVCDNHFMLLWDGSSLTLIDVGAGPVRIDGQELRGTATVRRGRVEFGSAAIVVDCEGPGGVIWQRVPTSRSGPNDLTLAPTPVELSPSGSAAGALTCVSLEQMQSSAPTIRIDNVEALVAELEGRVGQRRTPSLGVSSGDDVIEWRRPMSGATVAACPRSLGARPPKRAPATPRLAATRMADRAAPLPEPPPTESEPVASRRLRPATWLLAAAAGAALCVLLMAGGAERGAAAAAASDTDAGAPGSDGGSEVARESADAQKADDRPALAEPAGFVDPGDPLAAAHCERRRRCRLRTLERIAADRAVEGDYGGAAARYRKLAARTGSPRFAEMAELMNALETGEEHDSN